MTFEWFLDGDRIISNEVESSDKFQEKSKHCQSTIEYNIEYWTIRKQKTVSICCEARTIVRIILQFFIKFECNQKCVSTKMSVRLETTSSQYANLDSKDIRITISDVTDVMIFFKCIDQNLYLMSNIANSSHEFRKIIHFRGPKSPSIDISLTTIIYWMTYLLLTFDVITRMCRITQKSSFFQFENDGINNDESASWTQIVSCVIDNFKDEYHTLQAKDEIAI